MQSFKAQVYDVGLAVTPKLLKVGAKAFTTLDVRKLYQQVLLDDSLLHNYISLRLPCRSLVG